MQNVQESMGNLIGTHSYKRPYFHYKSHDKIHTASHVMGNHSTAENTDLLTLQEFECVGRRFGPT